MAISEIKRRSPTENMKSQRQSKRHSRSIYPSPSLNENHISSDCDYELIETISSYIPQTNRTKNPTTNVVSLSENSNGYVNGMHKGAYYLQIILSVIQANTT